MQQDAGHQVGGARRAGGFRASLDALLAAEGSLRFDRFMALANAQYYDTRDPFGPGGDFVTAPESTQVFGECLGLWAAVAWVLMGRPERCALVELGPGRGTLMADALRAVGQASPGFRAALEVHLVETSRGLREAQARAVPKATWHDGLDTLPELPAIVLANEFLDALPVRRLMRQGGLWHEVHVAPGGGSLLAERLVPAESVEGLPPEAPEGAERELPEAAEALVASLAARLARLGGVALLVDYGHGGLAPGQVDGATLTALRAHRACDPLEAPGEADLSAQVDFARIAAAARGGGALVQGPVPQGAFLTRLGFLARVQALLRQALPSQRASIEAAARRLVAASSMGLVYRAMAVAAPGTPDLPGFEPG